MTAKAMRICFIGDSFVSGAYDPECLGWAGRITADARRRGHDVSHYNLGIRGETSVQLAARWFAEAQNRQSQQQEGRLVFEFGVNDAREVNAKRQVESPHSLAAAREILGRASDWKPTLMIGPPPGSDEARNARVEELAGQFAVLCKEFGIPYFDSYLPLSASSVWRSDIKSVDGTHPSATGYSEWAKLIGEWPAWRDWLP